MECDSQSAKESDVEEIRGFSKNISNKNLTREISGADEIVNFGQSSSDEKYKLQKFLAKKVLREAQNKISQEWT